MIDRTMTLFVCTALATVMIPLLHVFFIRCVRQAPNTLLVSLGCCFGAGLILFACINAFIEPVRQSFALAVGWSWLTFFYLGYLEILFKLYRGFSYTLVTDVVRNGSMTSEDFMNRFAEGVGMETMFDRRVQTMVESGFIVRDDRTIRLTKLGVAVAVLTIWFKRLYKLGPGG